MARTHVDPADSLEALGRAIVRTRAELARIARAEGLAPEDAVDCVHDAFFTFLQMAQNGELASDDATYPALLAGIVRNVARNKRRRHHLARHHDAIEDADPRSDAPLAESLVARAEEHVRLRRCVDRLCDVQKAVVTMRMLDGHDGEDVATALGISRGYVDVLLHRAKRELLACMLEGETR